MNEELFKQLEESVQQADGIMKGKVKASRVTEIPEPKVKEIRERTGLTQARFAYLLGVSKRTLENWEQGRRQPTGPAKVLLRFLDSDPQYVLQTLNN
jgi:putative transcriptional regulator